MDGVDIVLTNEGRTLRFYSAIGQARLSLPRKTRPSPRKLKTIARRIARDEGEAWGHYSKITKTLDWLGVRQLNYGELRTEQRRNWKRRGLDWPNFTRGGYV